MAATAVQAPKSESLQGQVRSASVEAAREIPKAEAKSERQRMISEAAYFRAERRGFAPGGNVEDWLAAEADIDREMQSGGSQSAHAVAESV